MIVTYDELIRMPNAEDYKETLTIIGFDVNYFYNMFPIYKPTGLRKYTNFVRFILDENNTLIGYFIYGINPNIDINLPEKGLHLMLYLSSIIRKKSIYYQELEDELQQYGMKIYGLARSSRDIAIYNKFFSKNLAIIRVTY